MACFGKSHVRYIVKDGWFAVNGLNKCKTSVLLKFDPKGCNECTMVILQTRVTAHSRDSAILLYFFMSCCWMPDANFRTHWQSKATASKSVYYLLSLDSKEKEVFSYLSHLFPHGPAQTHPYCLCHCLFPLVYLFLY